MRYWINSKNEVLKPLNIGIIGAGNVGSHLCRAFSAAGHKITVFTRRGALHLLEDVSNLSWTERLDNLKYGNDFLFITVNDDSIAEIAKKLKNADGIILHTSGSVDIDVLSTFSNYGVFYPLQSFKTGLIFNYKEIPFFIEANNIKNLKKISNLAKSITSRIIEMSSEKRKQLHLSAVIVNNFINHLYTLSRDYLDDNNLNFRYLLPLIEETASRMEKYEPSQIQTGPAKRNDVSIMEEHAKMLNKHKDLQLIYRMMSESIKKRHNES